MLILQRGTLNRFLLCRSGIHNGAHCTGKTSVLQYAANHGMFSFMHLHFTMHGLCPAQTVLYQVLLECSIRWCDGSGDRRETAGAAKGILEFGQA